MSRLPAIASLLILSVAFIGGISAVGLLQTTENVSSSGIIVQPPPPIPSPPSAPPSPNLPPPPPEPTIEIDIYCDIDCTNLMESITWGEIQVGSSVSVNMFVLNNGESGVILSLLTENWNPSILESDVSLVWDYDGTTIDPGEVVEIGLTLSVDPNITNITSFNFDIIIVGSAI
jgi:hypothetical protein